MPQAPGAKTLALDVEGKTAQAYVSNSFNRDGADPALMKKMLDTAAQSATHNASSTEVILGRYIVGNDQSYEKVAQTRGATYFQLTSENWMKTANVINNDGMWEINKTFLDQQIKLGKDFIFTSDPSKFPLNSSSQREFTHLISKGYNFSPTGNGMYHATKK